MSLKDLRPATRHAWLGIDPGLTTGWALVDDDGLVRGTGNLHPDELEEALDMIVRSTHSAGYGIDAVVENMPRVGQMSQLSSRLEKVRATIDRVLVDTFEIPVRRVAPGEWKPSRVARTTPFPRGHRVNGRSLSSHQRDAIRMTLYVIDREKNRGD